MAELDLENRDINNLNNHVSTVTFHDVLGEPESVHSIDCVWKGSYACFNCTLGCCYKFMTIFCGIPLAFCWACEFACTACYHIWYMTPLLKCYEINMMVYQKLWHTCLAAFLAPCCETMGLFFSKIFVENSKSSKPKTIVTKPASPTPPKIADVEVASAKSVTSVRSAKSNKENLD